MVFTSKLHNMESLDDIIEDANKNIKKVFLAGVAPEFRQEAYIIGLKLTLDKLAQELEFVQKDDCSSVRSGDLVSLRSHQLGRICWATPVRQKISGSSDRSCATY